MLLQEKGTAGAAGAGPYRINTLTLEIYKLKLLFLQLRPNLFIQVLPSIRSSERNIPCSEDGRMEIQPRAIHELD
jgi:hypothetical protein